MKALVGKVPVTIRAKQALLNPITIVVDLESENSKRLLLLAVTLVIERVTGETGLAIHVARDGNPHGAVFVGGSAVVEGVLAVAHVKSFL